MSQLRAVTEQAGARDVSTLLNSGNVVLTSTRTATDLQRELSDRYTAEFGFPIPTVVVPADRMKQIVAAQPYSDGDPSRVTVVFVTGTPRDGLETRLGTLATPKERWTIGEEVVYIDFAQGQADSKLAVGLGKVFAPAVVTARSLRTATALAEILAVFPGS